jgi:hypothetical protein
MGDTMRKIIILAGLLLAAALVPGAPAKAAMGCACVKLGAHSVCTATVSECNRRIGGLCLAPCVYAPQKMGRTHVHVKHKQKMAQKPAHPKNVKDDKKKM